MTLQEQANKEGVSRQAVWLRTPKGKAWTKQYLHGRHRTPQYRLYHRHQMHKNKHLFTNCPLCMKGGEL